MKMVSGTTTEGQKKRTTEVETMATEVATAVAAARTAKIKHSRYGKAVDLSKGVLGLYTEDTLVKVLRATTVRDAPVGPRSAVADSGAGRRVLARPREAPPSMPLYDIKEGALVADGSASR